MRDAWRLIRELERWVTQRLSWRFAGLFVALPVFVVIDLGVTVALLDTTWGRLSEMLAGNVAIDVALWPAAWRDGQPMNIDSGFYFAWGPLLLSLMYPWVSAISRPTLPEADRRRHLGAVTGMWLSVMLAGLCCIGLASGIPDHEPVVVFVAIVSVQTLIATAAIPLIASLDRAR